MKNKMKSFNIKEIGKYKIVTRSGKDVVLFTTTATVNLNNRVLPIVGEVIDKITGDVALCSWFINGKHWKNREDDLIFEKNWEENIPESGVLCWVANNIQTKVDIIPKQLCAVITKKRDTYGYLDNHDCIWERATPVLQAELDRFLV